MPKDLSYKVTLHSYECEHCGRHFESHGPWAWGAVTNCEAECKSRARRGEVRVFLPPPGKWDAMFAESKWRFVKKDSVDHVCSKEGHDEKRYWRDHFSVQRIKIVDGIHRSYSVKRENEVVECKRCGVIAYEPGCKIRDKQS